MKKRMFVMAVILSVMLASPVFAAEWKQDAKGWRYQYDNGTCASSGIRNINGVNYAFDSNGYMLTGWRYLSFKWYYFDPAAGAEVYGWKLIDGRWYYLDPKDSGAMYTWWLDLDGKRYYLDESGALQTGVFYLSDDISGSRYAYQTDETGAVIRNTKKINGDKIIWYDENGIMRYQNNTTKQVGNAMEGDKWQYVLNEQDMEDQKAENEQIISAEVRRLQNQLYDEYNSKVLLAKPSQKVKKQNLWESKVKRKLTIYQTDQQISDYMTLVLNGRYVKVSEDEFGYSEKEEAYDEYYDNEGYYDEE